jgi:hypothetical protein
MIGSNAATTIAFFAATASVAWSAAYAWVKWLPHRLDGLQVPGDGSAEFTAERLARVEAQLEELTLEMERLAEGQRYSARLLEERLPRALPAPAHAEPPRSGRVVTPH